MLGGLDKVWEGEGVGNCVITAVCFRALDKGWEEKGVGELCVDSSLY